MKSTAGLAIAMKAITDFGEHPDLRDGEIFYGNVPPLDAPDTLTHTLTHAEHDITKLHKAGVRYHRLGNREKYAGWDCCPMFLSRDEITEKGFEIIDRPRPPGGE